MIKPYGLLLLLFVLCGCNHQTQTSAPPPSLSASTPLPSTPVGIAPPSASQAELAIVAAQDYKPAGSKESIQDWVGAAILMSKVTGFKDVGWGAEPSGNLWKATYVYIGDAGIERRAEWQVDLAKHSVVPLNSYARDLGAHALKLSK